MVNLLDTLSDLGVITVPNKDDLERRVRSSDASNKPTILFVDDNEALRKTLSDYFAGRGYNTLQAGDGNSAINLYQSQADTVDIVVMDAKMAPMDGFETTQRIHELNPEVPIIMLTAEHGDHDVEEVANIGLHRYVKKDSGEDGISTMLGKLKGAIDTGVEKYRNIKDERFFAHVHVKDIKTRGEIAEHVNQILTLTKRIPEDHTIAGPEEAARYIRGVNYPENSDYILFARELHIFYKLTGKRIVEFFSGPGNLSREMMKYSPLSVLGLDGSPEMIDFARKTHSVPNLNYQLCDLLKLKEMLPDLHGVDLITFQNSLHQLEFAHQVYELINMGLSILNIGGVMYCADYRRNNVRKTDVEARLLATNSNVRNDLVATMKAAFTLDEIKEILSPFGGRISVRGFYPEDKGGINERLEQERDYFEITNRDPHPHKLDWAGLSQRIEITKNY